MIMTYEDRAKMRERLISILARHVQEEDKELSDHDFAMIVHIRYLKSRQEYLVDPNE
jgi:hypothetical protein